MRFISVRVNGLEVGSAVVDDFFSKYGNCDGNNIVGLTAEAHLVRMLRRAGYKVMLLLSHNVEIRRVEKEGFAFDCVGNYGEVLDKMPDELRAIIEGFCEKGVDVKIEDEGETPVYFNDHLIFKASFKKIISRILSKIEDKPITRFMIFNPNMEELEPFLIALTYELLLMLKFDACISIPKLLHNEDRKILDHLEEALKKHGIHLEEDIDLGVKISNEEDLCEEFKLLDVDKSG